LIEETGDAAAASGKGPAAAPSPHQKISAVAVIGITQRQNRFWEFRNGLIAAFPR